MFSITRLGSAGTSVVACDNGCPAFSASTLNVGASLWLSRKNSAPRESALVMPSSRVTRGVHTALGSASEPTGVVHAATSFCTPLIESAAARGVPGLEKIVGNSSGFIAGPWPTLGPNQGTGSDFISQATAAEV